MVFLGLVNRQKTEPNTMNDSTIFLHNMHRDAITNSIHKARFNTLVSDVKPLLHYQQCSLASISRNPH